MVFSIAFSATDSWAIQQDTVAIWVFCKNGTDSWLQSTWMLKT